MWKARLLLLVLVFGMTPDPGVSQFGAQLSLCRSCKYYKEENATLFLYAVNRKPVSFKRCPHTDNIRFTLKNNEIMCANKNLAWAKKLMEYSEKCKDGLISTAPVCENGDSSAQKEFSKGTNEKPSTTTITAPTTLPVTSMKTSTQSWSPNFERSTEPADPKLTTSNENIVVNDDLDTTNVNKENINLHQGHKPSENPNVEDRDAKMKHANIAIISLIAIVLLLVAVFVGQYFRKKKTNASNVPCTSMYKLTPSQDSLAEVREP
ncbi:uncharacterized protein [Pyxicephalus adspersus]|uniref:uncharacterized protein n=1 Tax=Pyxicephalus adspersus TaxID=30357 RepID=UPI003B5BA39B